MSEKTLYVENQKFEMAWGNRVSKGVSGGGGRGERLQLDFSKKFRWGEKHPLMETRGDENHFSNGGDKSGAYMT